MSYPEVGVDGDVNPCYFFMREAEHCYHTKLYPQTDCKKESDNFLECHNKNKQVKHKLNRLNLWLSCSTISEELKLWTSPITMQATTGLCSMMAE